MSWKGKNKNKFRNRKYYRPDKYDAFDLRCSKIMKNKRNQEKIFDSFDEEFHSDDK